MEWEWKIYRETHDLTNGRMRASSQLDTQSARTSILTKCSVVFTLTVSAKRPQGSSVESDWIFRCTGMFSDRQDDFDFLSDGWLFNHRKSAEMMFLCVNTCLSYLFSFCRDRYVCWLVGRVHSEDAGVDTLSSPTFQRNCYSVYVCFSRFSLLTFPFSVISQNRSEWESRVFIHCWNQRYTVSIWKVLSSEAQPVRLIQVFCFIEALTPVLAN